MSEARVVVERSGPERPWVGQLVRLDVQLWRPEPDGAVLPPFSLADVDVPGAIALFRPEVSPPETRVDGGTSFLVQHRILLVFPQTDGPLTVPPIAARWTEGKTVHTIASKPLEFTAALAGKAGDDVLIAPKVDLAQSTDHALEGLRVGDGFTRRVVLSARDTDPVALPELAFAPQSGLGLYPVAPHSESSAERGQLTASRTFTATYVVERVGHYELPGLSVRYLEPASGRYLEAQVPPLEFWARPNPSLGLSMWGTAPGLGVLGFGIPVVLVAGLSWIVRRRLRGGPFAWERRLHERRAERRAFAELLRRARGGSAGRVLSATYDWLRLRLPGSTERTLSPLRAASAEAAEALASCERSAFGDAPGPIADGGLGGALRRARAVLGKREHAAMPLNLENTDSNQSRGSEVNP